MVDGGIDRGSGSPGIPRASSGGGMAAGQAAGTPGKTAAGGAAAVKAGATSLHKARLGGRFGKCSIARRAALLCHFR
jgi:hypothetical protein